MEARCCRRKSATDYTDYTDSFVFVRKNRAICGKRLGALVVISNLAADANLLQSRRGGIARQKDPSSAKRLL